MKVADYASLLRRCRSPKDLPEGRRLHEYLSKARLDQETYLGNLIVEMYGKCERTQEAGLAFQNIRFPNVYSWTILLAAYARNGQLHEAQSVLDKMPQVDTVSWNAMISAYTQQGYPTKAIHLLRRLDLEGVRADDITYLSVANACGELGDLSQGRLVHSRVFALGFQSKLHVLNALVGMYARCKCTKQAREVFECMHERDLISYNTMLAAYTSNVEFDKAVDTFNGMAERDVASWNTLISAFAQARRHKEAMTWLSKMDQEGVEPDLISFLGGLDACAGLTALAEGRLLHVSITHRGLESNVQVSTCLINMYGKCGSPEEAKEVFERMSCSRRDVILWNAMVCADAQNGCLQQALNLVHLMELEGLKRTEVTHLSILAGFSHAGTFEDGYEYFLRIKSDFGLVAGFKHFSCMIDLLARAGKLDEAEELITYLPFEPDVVSWTSLLSACKFHKDFERAERIAERMKELDPKGIVSISRFCVS